VYPLGQYELLAVPAGGIGYLEPTVLLNPSRMLPKPMLSGVFDPATNAY
jgi:hypothetical protein